MFYIQQDSEIKFADSNRQRLMDTLAFLPDITPADIKETDLEIENGFFVGSPEHAQWKAKQIRNMRNNKLAETDKYVLPDYPDENAKEKYKVYRQALRDLPQQNGFPYSIVWPEK